MIYIVKQENVKVNQTDSFIFIEILHKCTDYLPSISSRSGHATGPWYARRISAICAGKASELQAFYRPYTDIFRT